MPKPRIIYRHEIVCERDREHLLYTLQQDRRIMFCYAYFAQGATFAEALAAALEEPPEGYPWSEADAYVLDNSKTFVNGRCYI